MEVLIDMERIELDNGIKIPVIGFGPGGAGYSAKFKRASKNKILSLIQRAWNKIIVRPGIYRDYVSAISAAFNNGFELLDYSAAYGNGVLIGKALKKSGIKRDNVFLTTRVSNRAQFNGNIEEEFFEQLKNMGTDYFDLLMFHWPVPHKFIDTYKKMIELKEKGYARAIGVANCHQHHLKALIDETGVVPSVNQFEVHPLFTQKPLVAFCKEQGIAVEAYTPVARFDDRLMRLPLLKRIGDKYGKSIIQVVLRWHIQNGVIPVVRTLNKKHQKENLDIFDFELTEEEMKAIDGININSRLRYDPDNCDFTIL